MFTQQGVKIHANSYKEEPVITGYRKPEIVQHFLSVLYIRPDELFILGANRRSSDYRESSSMTGLCRGHKLRPSFAELQGVFGFGEASGCWFVFT